MSPPAPPGTAAAVARAVEQACLLEASAPKPGNVHPGQAFRDMRYEDFVASARAIAPVFAGVGARPMGETILAAVRATRRVTSANTNLGIILLLTPLARAAAVHPGLPLRDAAGLVLAKSTIQDARLAYEAIRLAAPGGLGAAEQQDVAGAPSVTLTEAMRLAADRDAVAREWTTAFETTFTVGLPALAGARRAGLATLDSVTDAYLALLAYQPDTLIARKLGLDVAQQVREEAGRVVRLPRGSAARLEAVGQLDRWLRDETNRRNPGATADLTAAAILAVILGRVSRLD